MKIFHVNNPASGNTNGKKLFDIIKKEFDLKNISHESIQTEYAGHATEIIKNLDFGKYDGIAVSGGDGTLFEVINGYFTNNSDKKIPIGVIPAGRGNAFAIDLDIQTNKWKRAIDLIASGNVKKVDVGLCTTENDRFYFVNILGFGFVTDVGQTAFKLRAFGNLSYILGVFHRTIYLKSYSMKIELDGKSFERENVFTEISNTRYTGRDFLMAPSALMDDGLLDITLLNKLSRTRLLQCLPKIFKGTHIEMKEVETFKAKKIKIQTSPNKLLTPDGQLMGSTPIEIECFKEMLPVFF